MIPRFYSVFRVCFGFANATYNLHSGGMRGGKGMTTTPKLNSGPRNQMFFLLAAAGCSCLHYILIALAIANVHYEFRYFSRYSSTYFLFFSFLHKIKKLWKSSAHLCACVCLCHCCPLSYFIASSGYLQSSFARQISKLLLAGNLAIFNIYSAKFSY